MVKSTYYFVKELVAEAVCVISNQKLTEKVVYGMKSRVSRHMEQFGTLDSRGKHEMLHNSSEYSHLGRAASLLGVVNNFD